MSLDSEFDVEKPRFDEGWELAETGLITKSHLEESKVLDEEEKNELNEGNIAWAKQILGSAWKGASGYASKGYSYIGDLTKKINKEKIKENSKYAYEKTKDAASKTYQGASKGVAIGYDYTRSGVGKGYDYVKSGV